MLDKLSGVEVLIVDGVSERQDEWGGNKAHRNNGAGQIDHSDYSENSHTGRIAAVLFRNLSHYGILNLSLLFETVESRYLLIDVVP